MEEQISAFYEKALKDLPTKYESPGTRLILIPLLEQLAKAGEELGLKPWPNPAIGTLPTGQVNALTLGLPGHEDYVIAFEDGLFTFALLLGKVVAQAFPYQIEAAGGIRFSTESKDISEIIESNPSVVQRFIEAVTAYTIYGKPGRAPTYILQDRYQSAVSSMLTSALELFVLGHEFGHILLGHLTSAKRRASVLPSGESDAEEVMYDWAQEYQADYIGAVLTVRAKQQLEKLDLALSFWGTDLFFSGMEVMDKAVSLLRFGDETRIQLGSHPPHAERRSFLRQALVENVGSEDAKGPIQLGEQVEFLVGELWNAARPVIEGLHADGARPSRLWLAGEEREG